MRLVGIALAAVGAAWSLSAAPAAADDPSACALGRGHTLSFTIENDLVADSDRDYTNGFRLDYVTPANCPAGLARWARANLSGLLPARAWYLSAGVGQSIYTPPDISQRDPDPEERPYAGWLYGAIAIAGDTGPREGGLGARLDTLALDIGVVGTAALGEPLQTEWHRLTGFSLPEGWDRQLEDEVAFRLIYDQKRRFTDAYFDGALEANVIPHANIALGTLDISAGAGLTVRIGQALDDDYGPPRVRPAVSSPGFFSDAQMFSWYLFAGGEIRAVGRNLLLEGNTFRDSRGVTIHPFYADLQAGAAIQLGRAELAYTHVFRSKEYIGQDEWAEFGSLNLRVKF